MRKIIGLILLVLCCNTWATEIGTVDAKLVDPYWVSKVNIGHSTVIFICDKNKKDCKCFMRDVWDDVSTKEFQCPKQTMEKK